MDGLGSRLLTLSLPKTDTEPPDALDHRSEAGHDRTPGTTTAMYYGLCSNCGKGCGFVDSRRTPGSLEPEVLTALVAAGRVLTPAEVVKA